MGKEGFDYLRGNRPGAATASAKTPSVENVAKPGVAGGTPIASAPPANVGLASAEIPEVEDVTSMFAARGGLIRGHYDLGGSLPYATEEVGKDPLQEIGEDDNQKYEMLKPASPPPSSGGSGLGDIANIAKIGATLFSMSDARMKDNIERVGELYDGQPIYRYNMKGSPKTQLGLMAQDLEHNGHGDSVAGLGGLKMVDYKRATDVAAGLAPRQGYQEGGTPRSEDEERILRAREAGRSPPPGVASGERPVGGVVPPEQIPSRSPYATLIGGMFGRDMKPETKQALTSENLWVPVLAGVGSMLASRSPYLGSAIGEGLVGGTSAYTGLQKQQS